jgi:hypothetical protein
LSYFFAAAMVEDLSDNTIADYREAFSAFDKVAKTFLLRH